MNPSITSAEAGLSRPKGPPFKMSVDRPITPQRSPPLYERADLCLGGRVERGNAVSGGDELMRGSFFAGEVRVFGEAEGHVLVRAEEAHDRAVLRVSGHAIPGPGREPWHALGDDLVEALANSAVGHGHRGDLLEHRGLAVGLLRRLLLSHRNSSHQRTAWGQDGLAAADV
jgi:hypothetical protein